MELIYPGQVGFRQVGFDGSCDRKALHYSLRNLVFVTQSTGGLFNGLYDLISVVDRFYALSLWELRTHQKVFLYLDSSWELRRTHTAVSA